MYIKHLESCNASDNYRGNTNEESSGLSLLCLLVGSKLKCPGKDKFPGTIMFLSALPHKQLYLRTSIDK